MNAVFVCAGLGKRFQPLSFTCPKSLTPLQGTPLLEKNIRFMRQHGVERITVVTGYMADRFSYLRETLDVELCYNPRFADTNNVTSLSCVRHLLHNTFILDGDLCFIEDFFPFFQPGRSQFISQRTMRGLEWELLPDEDGKVERVRKWSPSGWGMVGVSYWTGEAARLLEETLPDMDADCYWEDAALRVLEQTPVYATRIPMTFVREMDTPADALEMGLLDHREIAEICSTGGPPELLKGLTNNTWKIRDTEGRLSALRIPGKGTERYIKREDEPHVISYIERMGLTPETVFYENGFKTTHFLETHRVTNAEDLTFSYFVKLWDMLEKMHAILYAPDMPVKALYIGDDIRLYEQQSGRRADAAVRQWLLDKAALFDRDRPVLCHRDLLLENILVSGPEGQGMQLIDFEYAGFTHPLWDAASFILEAGMEGESRETFLRACRLEDRREELGHMEILVDYIWGLWGLVNDYTEYGERRLGRALARIADLPEFRSARR